jgi:hypothetical protein
MGVFTRSKEKKTCILKSIDMYWQSFDWEFWRHPNHHLTMASRMQYGNGEKRAGEAFNHPIILKHLKTNPR